jgi:hypothetical protein
MRRRRRLFWLGIGLALLLLLVAVPVVTVVPALLRGESFYLGRSSSSWAKAVQAWCLYHGTPPRWLPDWAERVLAYSGFGGGKPLVLRGGPNSVPVLLALARSDHAPTRLQAILSLGNWKLGRDPAVVLPILQEAVTDSFAEISAAAAHYLVREGPTGQAILTRAIWDLPPAYGHRLFEPLGILGSRAYPEFVKGLGHRDPFVRQIALQYLRQFAPKSGGLESEDYPTRVAAVAVLGNPHPAPAGGRSGTEHLPALREMLRGPDSLLRVLAAEAVWRLTGKEAEVLPTLVGAMGDADVAVRWNALRVVYGGGQGPWSSQSFSTLLPSTVPRALWQARFLQTLGREKLLAALGDTDFGVRELAGGLLQMAGPFGLSVLGEALRNPNARVRRAAVESLGTLGQEARKAVPHFAESLSDSDPEVREWAARVLKPGVP